LGNNHRENRPQEEGRLDATKTRRSVGSSETLKLHLARMIADVISTAARKRRNGDTSVGYSGQAALRREQCSMSTESQGVLLGNSTTGMSPRQQ
jgi:hypothetical protein